MKFWLHVWLELVRRLLGSPIYQCKSKEHYFPKPVPSLHLSLPAASSRSTPSFQETVTFHYAVSSAASSFGPRVAEQQQEELKSAWASGSLMGPLSPQPASKVVWLSGPGWAHAGSWPGQTTELFCWACLDEIFFSRCFGNQPKWYWKDALPFK